MASCSASLVRLLVVIAAAIFLGQVDGVAITRGHVPNGTTGPAPVQIYNSSITQDTNDLPTHTGYEEWLAPTNSSTMDTERHSRRILRRGPRPFVPSWTDTANRKQDPDKPVDWGLLGPCVRDCFRNAGHNAPKNLDEVTMREFCTIRTNFFWGWWMNNGPMVCIPSCDREAEQPITNNWWKSNCGSE